MGRVRYFKKMATVHFLAMALELVDFIYIYYLPLIDLVLRQRIY